MEVYEAMERVLILAHQQVEQMDDGEKKEQGRQAIEVLVNYYVAQLADYAKPGDHPNSERERRLQAWYNALTGKGLPVPHWLQCSYKKKDY